MAKQHVENQLGPSSQCELFPWKLVPVDLDKSVKEKANIPVQVSPSQTPGPILSVPSTLPGSVIEVELSEASYVMMKSMLSHLHLQDKNMTFFATDSTCNQPDELPSPIPKPALSVKSASPVQNAAMNESKESSRNVQNASKRISSKENASNQPVSKSTRPGPISSKIGIKDEPEFKKIVRKPPRLYDVKDPSYRDKKEKKKSSTAIDDDCQTKRKSLREKTNREMKQFVADEDRASNKTMKFPKNMRTGTKRGRKISEDCESPERSSTKRKKSENVPDPKSSAIMQKSKNFVETIPHSDNQKPVQEEPKTVDESTENIDQLFANTIAIELKRFSPNLKNILKAKIWQVLADFGNRI